MHPGESLSRKAGPGSRHSRGTPRGPRRSRPPRRVRAAEHDLPRCRHSHGRATAWAFRAAARLPRKRVQGRHESEPGRPKPNCGELCWHLTERTRTGPEDQPRRPRSPQHRARAPQRPRREPACHPAASGGQGWRMHRMARGAGPPARRSVRQPSPERRLAGQCAYAGPRQHRAGVNEVPGKPCLLCKCF